MSKTKTIKNSPLVIKILSTKENDDGSLDIELEYQKEWVDIVKKDLNKKKVTKKDVEKHFIGILTKAIQETDGYKLEKLKNIKD